MLDDFEESEEPCDLDKLVQLADASDSDQTVDVTGDGVEDPVQGQNSEQVNEKPRAQVVLGDFLPVVIYDVFSRF